MSWHLPLLSFSHAATNLKLNTVLKKKRCMHNRIGEEAYKVNNTTRLEPNSLFHHFLYLFSLPDSLFTCFDHCKKVRKFIHIYSLPTLVHLTMIRIISYIILIVSFTSYCTFLSTISKKYHLLAHLERNLKGNLASARLCMLIIHLRKKKFNKTRRQARLHSQIMCKQ
jgi:hypothetical protein